MPPTSAHFRNADRLANGRLASILLHHRDQGVSNHEIARRLYADHQIEVSVTTVGNWLRQLEAEERADGPNAVCACTEDGAS